MRILEITDNEYTNTRYRTGGEWIERDGSMVQMCSQCDGTGKERAKRSHAANRKGFSQGQDLNPTKICSTCHGKGFIKKDDSHDMNYQPENYESPGQFRADYPEMFDYLKVHSKKGDNFKAFASKAMQELKTQGNLSKDTFRKLEGIIGNKNAQASKDPARQKWDSMKVDDRHRTTNYNRTTKGQYGRHK